ncbi:hypothetical protein ACIBHY_08100 [Nonomuraea sp. NPDC050547]|uniref:hypothetical protein n=1 Tax=Nonomuraea sp. NPDC050547 TaxID=3364368 RepID=UPI0037B15C41
MKFFRREPSRRRPEDVDLDSLLALVADSLGYGCDFAADGATLTLTPGPDGGVRSAFDLGRDTRPMRDGLVLVRLTGLRREAGRRPREDWPTLVSEHLGNAVSGDLVDFCDLDQVRMLLRTRVEAVDAVEDLTRVVGRHLNGDLVELLSVGPRLIRPEEAGCWPLPSAKALELASRNVREGERLTVESIELSGTPVTRLTGPSPTAPTHLRWLPDYLPVPRDGVLVVLPDPYTLLVHPVNGLGVVRAIERLRLHAARTDGMSDQVYWWHEGRLTHLRADIVLHEGHARLVVTPPPDFAQVLARLAV